MFNKFKKSIKKKFRDWLVDDEKDVIVIDKTVTTEHHHHHKTVVETAPRQDGSSVTGSEEVEGIWT